jgi:hypothetical protein
MLHVGDHRLERLFADFGPVTGLVAHAAGLAAHAQGAGLASVLAAHRFPQLPNADPTSHAQRVPDRRPTATALHPPHSRIPFSNAAPQSVLRRLRVIDGERPGLPAKPPLPCQIAIGMVARLAITSNPFSLS